MQLKELITENKTMKKYQIVSIVMRKNMYL